MIKKKPNRRIAEIFACIGETIGRFFRGLGEGLGIIAKSGGGGGGAVTINNVNTNSNTAASGGATTTTNQGSPPSDSGEKDAKQVRRHDMILDVFCSLFWWVYNPFGCRQLLVFVSLLNIDYVI